LIFKQAKKKISVSLPRIKILITKKFNINSQKYGFGIWDPGKPIPDPGSGDQKWHRIPDPEHCFST
jgi:hypothetical protein